MGDELRTTKPWLPALSIVTGEPLQCSGTLLYDTFLYRTFRGKPFGTRHGKELWNGCSKLTSQIYPCLFLLVVSIEKSETERFLNPRP